MSHMSAKIPVLAAKPAVQVQLRTALQQVRIVHYCACDDQATLPSSPEQYFCSESLMWRWPGVLT